MKNLLLRSLENIYQYDNYRYFLKDYFHELKAKRRAFSHRYFAQKAGFASPTFVYQLIKGERNLTANTLQKIVKGLDISGKELQYFTNLVHYNQAKTTADQDNYRENLHKLRKTTNFYRTNKKQLSYFSDSHLQVIMELATYSDWGNDYKKLGKLAHPSIPASEAKKAVETLLDLKLLKKSRDGYKMTNELVTSEGVAPVFQKELRRDLLLKGVSSVEEFRADERHASFGVVSMSEKCYGEIAIMYDEFRREVFRKISEDEEKERVYNMSLLLFPISDRFKKEER